MVLIWTLNFLNLLHCFLIWLLKPIWPQKQPVPNGWFGPTSSTDMTLTTNSAPKAASTKWLIWPYSAVPTLKPTACTEKIWWIPYCGYSLENWNFHSLEKYFILYIFDRGARNGIGDQQINEKLYQIAVLANLAICNCICFMQISTNVFSIN